MRQKYTASYIHGIIALSLRSKISTTRSLQVRKMKYRLPEINDKDILQKYVQEHHNNGETSISASLGLSSSEYTEWVILFEEEI